MNSNSIHRKDVKVIQSYVDLMVGIPKFSYPARQNDAPKPKDEFAHIRLLEEYPVGIPNQVIHAQDDLTTTFRTYSPSRLRFRIGVVDTDGLASSKVMHGWTSEAMKNAMKASGYGFIKCDPLSNESAKLEKEWEMRQGFSVEVYATRIFDEVVDNITSLKISGETIFPQVDDYLTNLNINND